MSDEPAIYEPSIKDRMRAVMWATGMVNVVDATRIAQEIRDEATADLRARLEIAEGLIRKYATDDDYRWNEDRYEPGFITNPELALLDDVLASL